MPYLMCCEDMFICDMIFDNYLSTGNGKKKKSNFGFEWNSTGRN